MGSNRKNRRRLRRRRENKKDTSSGTSNNGQRQLVSMGATVQRNGNRSVYNNPTDNVPSKKTAYPGGEKVADPKSNSHVAPYNSEWDDYENWHGYGGVYSGGYRNQQQSSYSSTPRYVTPSTPELVLSMEAYLKARFMSDVGGTEVGFWGVARDAEHPLHIVDFVLLPQSAHSTYNVFDDDALGEYYEQYAERFLERMLVWGHTHPRGIGARPSGTDEQTINGTFGQRHAIVMFIICQDGQMSARLRLSQPFLMAMELPIRIDQSHINYRSVNFDAWKAEYETCVRRSGHSGYQNQSYKGASSYSTSSDKTHNGTGGSSVPAHLFPRTNKSSSTPSVPVAEEFVQQGNKIWVPKDYIDDKNPAKNTTLADMGVTEQEGREIAAFCDPTAETSYGKSCSSGKCHTSNRGPSVVDWDGHGTAAMADLLDDDEEASNKEWIAFLSGTDPKNVQGHFEEHNKYRYETLPFGPIDLAFGRWERDPDSNGDPKWVWYNDEETLKIVGCFRPRYAYYAAHLVRKNWDFDEIRELMTLLKGLDFDFVNNDPPADHFLIDLMDEEIYQNYVEAGLSKKSSIAPNKSIIVSTANNINVNPPDGAELAYAEVDLNAV